MKLILENWKWYLVACLLILCFSCSSNKKYLEGSVKVTLPSPRSKPNTCSPGLSGLKGARRSFTQKSSIQKTVKNWRRIRLSG